MLDHVKASYCGNLFSKNKILDEKGFLNMSGNKNPLKINLLYMYTSCVEVNAYINTDTSYFKDIYLQHPTTPRR